MAWNATRARFMTLPSEEHPLPTHSDNQVPEYLIFFFLTWAKYLSQQHNSPSHFQDMNSVTPKVLSLSPSFQLQHYLQQTSSSFTDAGDTIAQKVSVTTTQETFNALRTALRARLSSPSPNIHLDPWEEKFKSSFAAVPWALIPAPAKGTQPHKHKTCEPHTML